MLDDQDNGDVLFSEATLKLGEIHWALLKAASLMDSKRWGETRSKEGFIGFKETTAFGKEVGSDEIHWWVFQKETNVDELYDKTNRALESAQTLKEAASRLNRKEPKSYEELLLSLKDFAEQNRTQIDSLQEYVSWLSKRDAMAPRILFTYRVWGSTRMSDRYVNVKDQENAKSDVSQLHDLTEIVLGVRDRGMLVYDRVHMEIEFDIFESLDPEQLTGNVQIVVPESQVIRRTAHAVYENCGTYFTEIRDSLRNIVVDIGKFKEQQALFESSEFWRDFITKARNAKTSETQLWDFKETLTIWHVKKDPERREAKVTFAEDVASFANSIGGVLVVGVNDKREIVGIGSGGELENRLKTAADVLANHIDYDGELVSFLQIAVVENSREKICLIVLISQAYRPVAVSDGQGHYSYPVRRETGISRVSRDSVAVRKLGVGSDNRDFMHQLERFVHDN